MELLKSRAYIEQPLGWDLQSMYEHIERCGRTCYKSEWKIEPGSAEKFVNMIASHKGGDSPLEHGTVYLTVPMQRAAASDISGFYSANKFSKVSTDLKNIYISTNYRVISQNGRHDDLDFMTDPRPEFHFPRLTVRFIMDRIGSQSFVRHRSLSPSQESTRFCNYSHERFGSHIQYILPHWAPDSLDGTIIESEFEARRIAETVDWGGKEPRPRALSKLLLAGLRDEWDYMDLLSEGLRSEDARDVLPFFLKTDIVMTGWMDPDGWLNFLDLRTQPKAHKGAQALAKALKGELDKGFDYFAPGIPGGQALDVKSI